MEMVYIVVIGLVVWYLGAQINAMVQGTAEMAEGEFKSFKREQSIRLHKTRAAQTAKVKTLSELEAMSDKEFDDFFKVLKGTKDEEA